MDTTILYSGVKLIAQSQLAKHAFDTALKGLEARWAQLPFASPTAKEEHKNRLEIIKSGHFIWIKMLENSLHNEILIPLELYEQTDASDNPFRDCVQEADQPAHMLPAGTSISEVYQKPPGELLILGEPGAGKTTLLLQLARDQLNRAETDEGEPIPVVFHLASWAENQVPLDRWLTEEMDKKYHIQKKIGWFWIKSKELLLLLDGLDEVAPQAREKCIQAINDYRQKYSPAHIVVCSQYNEYFNQAVKLHPDCVVRIQPLTNELVNDYLTRLGKQGAGIRTMLQNDDELQKMANTPFMLDVLTRAYPDKSSSTTLSLQRLSERLAPHLSGGLIRSVVPKLRRIAVEAKQQHFFITYVERMLKHRQTQIHTSEQTVGWLAFLAREIAQQNRTTFSIRYVQPDSQLAQKYQGLLVWLSRIVMGILVSLLVNALLLGIYPGSMLLSMTIATLIGVLIVNLLSARHSEKQPTERNVVSQKGWWYHFLPNRVLINVILIAVITLLNIELLFQSIPTDPKSILIIVGSILILSIFAGLLLKVISQETNPLKNGLLVGGFIGLILPLSSGLNYGWSYGWPRGLTYGIITALGNWAVYIPASILLSAILVKITGTIQPAGTIVWSWKNIWRSLFSFKHLRNALLIGGFIGIFITMLHVIIFYGISSQQNKISSVQEIILGIERYSRGIGLMHIGYHFLLSWFIYSLIYWFLVGIFNGWHSNSLDEDYHFEPTKGIQICARNSMLVGLFTVIPCLILYIIAYTLYTWDNAHLLHIPDIPDMGINSLYNTFISIWNINLIPGLFVTLLAGFMVPALLEGYLAYIQHSIQCRFLRNSGSLPRDLPGFLDDANKRILLDDIGGGYRFHPLLLKYFAGLSDEQIRAYREVVPRR